tara:strand:- start:264 stop:428 length:165 start_codon:yes stop_codon:yes gene_type:complete
MRANAIEKGLVMLLNATAHEDDTYIQNVRTKCLILLDRKDDRAASVIRELMNGK